jgi:excisionase family DNA binding protein
VRGNLGQLLDVNSGATLMGQTERWVRKRIERKVIPFRKIGGRVYLVRSELEEWLARAPGVSPTEAIDNALARGEGSRCSR